MPDAPRWLRAFARLRDECRNANVFRTLADARCAVAEWRRFYSQQRPHSALGPSVARLPAKTLSRGFWTFFLSSEIRVYVVLRQGLSEVRHKLLPWRRGPQCKNHPSISAESPPASASPACANGLAWRSAWVSMNYSTPVQGRPPPQSPASGYRAASNRLRLCPSSLGAGPSAAAHPNAHRCALGAPGPPRVPLTRRLGLGSQPTPAQPTRRCMNSALR